MISEKERQNRISIHTPLAGSDQGFNGINTAILQFQSTLPLRGVTSLVTPAADKISHFNPHSPCGE